MPWVSQGICGASKKYPEAVLSDSDGVRHSVSLELTSLWNCLESEEQNHRHQAEEAWLPCEKGFWPIKHCMIQEASQSALYLSPASSGWAGSAGPNHSQQETPACLWERLKCTCGWCLLPEKYHIACIKIKPLQIRLRWGKPFVYFLCTLMNIHTETQFLGNRRSSSDLSDQCQNLANSNFNTPKQFQECENNMFPIPLFMNWALHNFWGRLSLPFLNIFLITEHNVRHYLYLYSCHKLISLYWWWEWTKVLWLMQVPVGGFKKLWLKKMWFIGV